MKINSSKVGTIAESKRKKNGRNKRKRTWDEIEKWIMLDAT